MTEPLTDTPVIPDWVKETPPPGFDPIGALGQGEKDWYDALLEEGREREYLPLRADFQHTADQLRRWISHLAVFHILLGLAQLLMWAYLFL